MKRRFLSSATLAIALAASGFSQGLGTLPPSSKIIGSAIEGSASPANFQSYARRIAPGEGFGVQRWSVQTITAAGFTQLDDGRWSLSPSDGMKSHVSGNNALTASVSLPDGALVDGFTARFNDIDPANSATFQVWRLSNINDSVTILGSYTTGASPGSTPAYLQFPTAETIDNLNNQYMASIVSPSSTVHVKGFTFWYHRQISPAPATASYSDVPSSHIFYPSIEALKASGITTGCSATQFCPDEAVTRGQVAALLARALGLHWGP